MISCFNQRGPLWRRILCALPAVLLVATMTACGPKPAEPPVAPPAGGPTGSQASPDVAQASPDLAQASPDVAQASPDAAQASPDAAQSPAAAPQAPPPGGASPAPPPAPTEVAPPSDPAIAALWKDVEAKAVVAQATETMKERSQSGVALFRSGGKDHEVKFEALTVLGIEPDSSMRLGTKVLFDGSEVPAQVVATKEGKKISFDAVAVDFPDGRVTFLWNEADTAWIAMEPPKS